MTAPTFLVGHKPGGISAVVLRRGGKLQAVPVEEMLHAARHGVLQGAIDRSRARLRAEIEAEERELLTQIRKKKPTKRKGAKR